MTDQSLTTRTVDLPRVVASPRIEAVRSLGAMQQPRTADFDALARLAAKVCDVPTAALNILDDVRQHSIGAFGWEPDDVDVDETLCSKSILMRDISYTENAATDERWVGNAFTDGRYAEIKLYAAAPLVLSGGEVAGTICAFSEADDSLSRVQLEMLRDLAALAVRMLELHDANERLGAEALRDALTGLPNRTLLTEDLQRRLARHARGASAPSVLFLDMDGFKTVNDVHGHHIGDELLRAIAARLLETVRATDLLARWGGDEFVVVCDGDDTASRLEPHVNRIRSAFDRPFDLACGPTQVGVSIGRATATGGETAASLLATADAAMYFDKRLRRRAERTPTMGFAPDQ